MYKIPFKNINEIKEISGWMNINYEFDNLSSSIVLSVNFIIDVVGQAVYDLAITHYESAEYGTGGTEIIKRLDLLVKYVQVPLWYFAFNDYMPFAQVLIDNDGIHVVKEEGRTAAYKYLTDSISHSTLQHAYNYSDILINFLDANKTHFTQWTDSDQFKESKTLFFNIAKDFSKYFNINNSSYFFIHLRNFIREVEDIEIYTRLGITLFNEIKAQILCDDLSDPNKIILDKIKRALAFKVMQLAITRLAIEVLPNGVFQNYISDQAPATKASVPAAEDLKAKASLTIGSTGDRYLLNLEAHLVSIAEETAEEAGEEYVATDYTEIVPDLTTKFENKKFMSL